MPERQEWKAAYPAVALTILFSWEEKMKRIFFLTVLTVLIACASAGFVSAENIIKGPGPSKCPSPDKCGACHTNQRTYNELILSSHADLSCFDCHLPGVVQKSKYERKDRSFKRQGYHIEADTWCEASGNDVCLRCHENKVVGSTFDNCWSCHMPVTGVDEIVFMKDKKKPLGKDNIREVKKLPHRSHLFQFHPKK
jgi:nitrate/TMAO reductase-like tetraheme cytochrome c subunit